MDKKKISAYALAIGGALVGVAHLLTGDVLGAKEIVQSVSTLLPALAVLFAANTK